jgi:hypothetical protein
MVEEFRAFTSQVYELTGIFVLQGVDSNLIIHRIVSFLASQRIHAYAGDVTFVAMEVIPASWLDFTSFRMTNRFEYTP